MMAFMKHITQEGLLRKLFKLQMCHAWKLIFVILTMTFATVQMMQLSTAFLVVARDHCLKDSLIYQVEVESMTDCAHLCLLEHRRCKSINIEKIGWKCGESKIKCQLNNNTKANKRDKLIVNPSFDYFEPIETKVNNRLSSFSELNQEQSCAVFYEKGARQDGVYTINPDGQEAFDVRCDMTTAGGGWTVFQRRMDGSVNFYLGWAEYKNGFGNLNGEFWLGLDKINKLSMSGQDLLRVDLEDFEGSTRYAVYNDFGVSGEAENYKLAFGDYTGNAGDSLRQHNGMKFTTKDADSDLSSINCATRYKGAWWYKACHSSNLNGLYHGGPHTSYADGVNWHPFKGHYYSLKTSEMKVRPRLF